MVVTGDGELGFDSEREPEKRLPHPRKAAGANYPILTRELNLGMGRPSAFVSTGRPVSSVGRYAPGLNWPAWDNIIGFRSYCVGLRIGVMINRDSRGIRFHSQRYRPSLNHKRCRPGSADVAFRTPLAPYEKSKFLGSGGSMVARLKLKGIDGRAPPGVEPAA
ncbi:hypothetical protein Bca4012_102939 [Brassica carinata]